MSVSEGAVVQPTSGPSTETVTKAPTVTKAACAKLSTSIRPKIRVSPDATRNSIIPMVSPATVSVTQAVSPIAGKAAKTMSGVTA